MAATVLPAPAGRDQTGNTAFQTPVWNPWNPDRNGQHPWGDTPTRPLLPGATGSFTGGLDPDVPLE